jgi:TonB family protein
VPLAVPPLPAPPGSRRATPPASRPGGGAVAGAASGTGAEAAPRGDAQATERGQDVGARGERQLGAAAATAEGDETAGEPAVAGGPAEDSRRGQSPASSGAGAGAAESAGEAGGAARPMVRGDVIPPGAPRSTPPRLLSRPEPQYPDRARRRQVESDVLLLVLVDENGRVVRAIVKRTDDVARLGFNEAARRAAFRTTFNPASRDGLPGKMWTELPFSFRLHPGE